MGTRQLKSNLKCHPRDHPHACGDKTVQHPRPPQREGSSPRVWGQADSRYYLFICHRIIPTRVGTSTQSFDTHCRCWDHPHACGDKLFDGYIFCCQTGSSPRVWGQAHLRQVMLTSTGIIPTRVGTSNIATAILPIR